MGDMSKEPSMEEILSSIKRIIAEEGNEAVRGSAPLRRGKPAPVIDELPELDADEADIEDSLPEDAMPMDEADEILELTQEIAPEKPVTPPKMTKAAPAASADTILSVESEVATRHSLSALSSMLVKSGSESDNTLEALVRSLLKPLLKEWLDKNLPELVEGMVAKEIARITGRSL